jgi:hypothetical protein
LPNFVVEVAFSETAEHARRKADFWLESSSICQVVVLMVINETAPLIRGTNGVENIVPRGNLEDPEDDYWVGDLGISIEVIRRDENGYGTYTDQNIVYDPFILH